MAELVQFAVVSRQSVCDRGFKEAGQFGRNHMATVLGTPVNVQAYPMPTVPVTVKIAVPVDFWHKLDLWMDAARSVVDQMLIDKARVSTSYYKQLPSVVAKGLSRKYQQDKSCKAVKRIVLPICGDKGRQVQLVNGRIRIPVLDRKLTIPFDPRRAVYGCIRNIEFRKSPTRNGGSPVWTAHITYDTLAARPLATTHWVGVDCNAYGNIAAIASPATARSGKLGINSGKLKYDLRQRRKKFANLKGPSKRAKARLIARVDRKISSRTKYENHVVSKRIVEIARTSNASIAMEDLTGAAKKGSKSHRVATRSSWAYAQLQSFVSYKAALAGVPVVFVPPAYTSQTCRKCSERTKTKGKLFVCPCGHTEHRDINAAFNIAMLSEALSNTGLQSNGKPLRLAGAGVSPKPSKRLRRKAKSSAGPTGSP